MLPVPFQLRYRSDRARPAALWLASADPRSLAALCIRLGETWPEIFALADGFLVVPENSPPIGLPRTVALRRLAENLYLPVDADLIPALHHAEAADLAARRGLLFLPGRILSFDPEQPVKAGAVIAPACVRRESWAPFPFQSGQAEQLRVIQYDGPTHPDAILESGRPDGKSSAGGDRGSTHSSDIRELRPESASPIRRVAAGAVMGLGQLVAWLGRALRQPGIARTGARMIQRAVENVPRLTERILGKQEAALRELLRRFKSGDIEGALRYAPPAVNDGSRPGVIDSGSTLDRRDPRYSLSALLGHGRVSIWLGGGNAWAELSAEYRRIARLAAEKGDYRRAAYIYGVLLSDLRLAADTLNAGGLFRDAAILYRDRLNDSRAAAVAFERAGDFDAALGLYRQTGQFQNAAELLRRLGDEAGAVEMYQMAADRLASENAWLAAGDLLRSRARRLDLAMNYYRLGWQSSTAGSVGCGKRLFDLHLSDAAWPELWKLLDEAETHLAAPAPAADSGQFFGFVLAAAANPVPDDVQFELRDRARMALANRLRSDVAGDTGQAISELFGRSPAWPPAVVRDAGFALSRRRRQEKAGPAGHSVPVRLVSGRVTSAAIARGSFDVVVGSSSGEVVVWRLRTGQLERVTSQGGCVDSIATDARGQVVVTMHFDGDNCQLRCHCVTTKGRFQYSTERVIQSGEEAAQLLPVVRGDRDDFHVDAIDNDLLTHFRGPNLIPEPDNLWASRSNRPNHLLLMEAAGVWRWSGRRIELADDNQRKRMRLTLGWEPCVPDGSPLSLPRIEWLNPESGVLEITGISQDGSVNWAKIRVADDRLEPELAALVLGDGDHFRASALIAPGRIAAVSSSNDLHWLRVAGGRFEFFATGQRLLYPSRVAALLARPGAGVLIAIFDDGMATQAPIPALNSK